MITGGEVRGVSASASPRCALDVSYLFLAFVGFLYLIIGLFSSPRVSVLAPPRSSSGRSVLSVGVYVLTPRARADTLWKLAWVAEDVFRRASSRPCSSTSS